MRDLVSLAKFGVHHLKNNEMGFCDGWSIKLNARMSFTPREMCQTLLHEALHNTVLRTRDGQKYLSEETEHQAIALLGDRDEIETLYKKEWGIEPTFHTNGWLWLLYPWDT